MTEQNNWVFLLLDWFDHEGRSLPWREAKPRNPYHVWVSEIMLQQTRTEAVKGYFQNWLAHFPTIQSLAEASEQDVLQAWQGLGYYSRARNLQKAAREILVRYGGTLPQDPEELVKLPGIGEYTAGAIASMAFGKVVPAVDGNLLRVLARVYAVADDILSTKGKKRLQALASETIPETRPGDYNEALMDLGAEICIPKHPRCEACPIRAVCRAFERQLTEELPHRQKRNRQKIYFATSAIFIRDGQVLLRRRPGQGLLASMWEFPTVLAETEEESRAGLETIAQQVGSLYWQHKHVFSHQIWLMKVYWAEGFKGDIACCSWVPLEEPAGVPLAGPHAKLFQVLCQDGLFQKETEQYRVAEERST